MNLQSAESLSALLASTVAVLTVVMSAKGKWDRTNYLLESLIKQVEGNERDHRAAHARMDRRTERIERGLDNHIGRHRQTGRLGSVLQKVVYIVAPVPYPPCTVKGGPPGWPLACLWAGECVRKTDKCKPLDNTEESR